tara:strand:- start:591 stop:1775 length:1185 start_codon:yes stop_codon:yes gene_type:complete
MNIAVFLSDLSVCGGSQRAFLQNVHYLLSKGHEISIYCCTLDKLRCFPPMWNGLEYLKVKKLDIDFNGPRLLFRRPFISLDVSRYIDVHDIYYFWDNVGLWLSLGVRLRRRKNVIWCAIDMPDYYYCGVYEDSKTYMDFGLVKRCLRKSRDFFHRAVDRYVFGSSVAHCIVHVGKNAKLVKTFLDLESTVAYPVADIAFKGLAAQREHVEPIFVTSIAAMFPYRRFEDLISAAAILMKRGVVINLVVAGETKFSPDYFEKLKALVEFSELGSTVILRGALTEIELKDILLRTKIFVWCNHNQSWGVIVPEAITAGVPVIVSRTSGVSEIIAHERHGLIVDSKSPIELAQAIERMLFDKEFVKRSTKAAELEILPKLTLDVHGKTVENVLFEFSQ